MIGAAVTVLATIALASGGASACACGEFHGHVVAHGTSPNGLPWRIKVRGPFDAPIHRRAVEINFTVGQISDGGGYRMALWTQTVQHILLHALSGTVFNSYSENDLSGVTERKAARLEVGMSEGGPLIIRPQFAPLALRRRFKWLGELRFFDAFFQVGIKPRWVRILDHEGALLRSVQATRWGGFDSWH